MNTATSPARIALVTGARGGIGREVVARQRTSGHRVAAGGRNAETLAQTLAVTLAVTLAETLAEGAADAMAWLLPDGAARIAGQVRANYAT